MSSTIKMLSPIPRVEPEQKVASLFWRAGAWMIDITLFAWPAFLFTLWITGDDVSALQSELNSWPSSSIVSPEQLSLFFWKYIGVLVYFSALFMGLTALGYGISSLILDSEGPYHNMTWGKRWLGICVVDLNHEIPTPAQIGTRFFIGGTLNWIGLNLGHALMHWRKDNRGLHDLIAKTQVIDTNDVEDQHRWMIFIAALLAHVLSQLAWMSLNPFSSMLSELVDKLVNPAF